MKYLQNSVKIISDLIFLFVILLVLASIAGTRIPGEAYMGDFGTTPYTGGWELTMDGTTQPIELPFSAKGASGKELTIRNTLPPELENGMRLCLRANMEDVEILVDGQLRGSYSSEGLGWIGYYTPSAYVFADLNAEDGGKQITIRYLVKKTTGNISEITIGYGNNAWFRIISENSVEFVAAIFMILMGFFSIFVYLFFKWRFSANRSVLFLGQTIMMLGIWVISESKLRQLIFHIPSGTNLFCYLSLEILAIYVLLYFDEVQNHTYHRIYLTLECICLGQLLVNMIADFSKLVYFHDTLIFIHIWMIVSIVVATALIIRDVRTGLVAKYRVTAVGMVLFLLFGVLEIINYYIRNLQTLGLYLCIGLVLMLGATILQTMYDIYRKEKESREHIQKATLTTIETIASSIDAKDEYTGGHSERVAYYATVLARELAGQYGFTSQDILSIHYVALMHDIGKIGVPDVILNKAGRLTDDEFQLIKRHTLIGDALLKDIDTIPGLSDGVRHHHERYDGKGYPDGLKGEEIPLIARILCLADCYDAMTSNRVYRARLSDSQVRQEIEKCSGTQFDPALAKKFCELLDAGKLMVRTQNGFEGKENGEILKSSLLRHLLVQDMAGGKYEISNPSFVRMLSYVVKMAEKREQMVRLFLIGVENRNSEEIDSIAFEKMKDALKTAIAKCMGPVDISVEYSGSDRVVVWFDVTEEEVECRKREVARVGNETWEISFREIDPSIIAPEQKQA